jgi:chemotaxis protein MotB
MRKRHEEHENHERWLVSYADFITLLFAFFVVMYATSTNNVDKQKEFENSVRVNLRLASGTVGQDSGAVPDAGEIIAEHLQGTEGPDGFPKQGKSAEAADYTARYLNQKISADAQKALGMQVRHDAIGVRVSLAASAVFPEGEYKMKRSALETLNKLGELLRQTDKKVIIEGHTDDQPAESDKFASNWELGSLRATSVVRYLIKYQNIDPKRMAAISYADQKPIVPNDTPEHRAENRRIEVLIVTDEPK